MNEKVVAAIEAFKLAKGKKHNADMEYLQAKDTLASELKDAGINATLTD